MNERTASVALLAQCIATRGRRFGGHCVTVDFLASDFGRPSSSIRKALRMLEAAHAVERVGYLRRPLSRPAVLYRIAPAAGALLREAS